MTDITRDIARAAQVLDAGGLVAVPTETVYGLGADAENPAAVRRIFAVKRRPADHPVIVHLGADAELAAWAAAVPDSAAQLARRFWPGPLTLVLRRHPRVPLEVTGGLDTVALRVPAHPVALALLARFGRGVAAPSANRFTSVSPTTAAHVRDELGGDVDLILDGGPCQVGLESTIVDLTSGRPALLRTGGVSREELEAALGTPVEARGAGAVRAPGQHPLHYAPRAEVVLVADAASLAREADRLQRAGRRVGALLPAERGPVLPAGVVVHAIPPDEAGYARHLYAALRALDRDGCDVIVAALPAAERGLGAAIADRLRRAAGPRPQRR